jgi:hypothetical protein
MEAIHQLFVSIARTILLTIQCCGAVHPVSMDGAKRDR